MFIKINGNQHYLWRAVDQDGNELDILVTKKRNKISAIKFFKRLLKRQPSPNQITTDKLRSYKAAINDLDIQSRHVTDQYANNLAEISHQKVRQKQRQVRQFKSMAQAQRLSSYFGIINNHVWQQRHLLKAKH